jgi:predicted regulator of Ras-like GTPase activity (Roadblock/LC7/MglB family)
MSKLVSISDVRGAALLSSNGSVISWRSNDNGKPKRYIDLILRFTSNEYQRNINNYKDGMFNESILTYNGYKVLMSKIRKNVILMLVLEKKAYLGLTMLDVAGCLHDIDSALDDRYYGTYDSSEQNEKS